jgi:hypothetical protein
VAGESYVCPTCNRTSQPALLNCGAAFHYQGGPVTGQGAEPQDHLRIDGQRLRQRLADVAVAIACTEDKVAETMERMVWVLPEDAAILRARAAQAREYAAMERGRAARYSAARWP